MLYAIANIVSDAVQANVTLGVNTSAILKALASLLSSNYTCTAYQNTISKATID